MQTINALRAALFAASLSGAIVMSGCSSTKLNETPPAPVVDRAPAPAPASPPPVDTRNVAPVDTSVRTLDPLNDPSSPLAKRAVFFDFDSFSVKPEFQPVVEAHGRFLATNKARHIVIEGNTDERGGREYNLALGQKRSDAVRERLKLLGVAETQVETVSFGKEKPAASGSTEDAWAQNRRADIKYR
jgi:peptidoglycan-associated lipoprotein